MAKVVVHFDNGQLRDLLQGPEGGVVRDLERRLRRVEAQAKRLCPVDNGTLRNSIKREVVRADGRIVGRVGSNLPYARHVHDGTGIHGPRHAPITSKTGKMLKIPVRGVTSSRASTVPGRGRVVSKSQAPTGFIFRRSVKGIKGTPYLRAALQSAR